MMEPMELDFEKAPHILGTVVDAMPDGVFTVDVQGCFVAWSCGAERLTTIAARTSSANRAVSWKGRTVRASAL